MSTFALDQIEHPELRLNCNVDVVSAVEPADRDSRQDNFP